MSGKRGVEGREGDRGSSTGGSTELVPGWRRVAWLGAAVAGLALLAYADSLRNGFVWDDRIVITRQLPALRSVGDVLFPPRNLPQYAPDYYRPLVTASLLIDRYAGGDDPWWFHFSVVLAHCLTTAGVFALGLDLFGGSRARGGKAPVEGERALVAALGAALFAVHPIHTEAVAWVSGRSDVLAAMFAVAAALAFIRARDRPRMAWAAGGATLLALLAKEAAIALVAILPVLDSAVAPGVPSEKPGFATRAERRRVAAAAGGSRWPRFVPSRYLPVAGALVVYAALRIGALGLGEKGVTGGAGRLVPDAIVATGVYLSKLVLPLGMNAYIAELPRGTGALAGSGISLLACAAAWHWLLRRGERTAAAMVAWAMAGIAPALAVIAKIPEAPVAERYLYLPSVGFCLLVARAVVWAWEGRRSIYRALGAGLAMALLVWWTAVTVQRNRVWRSDLELWRDTAEKSPTAGLPLRSLGTSMLAAGRADEAASLFERALEKRNNDIGRIAILSNLGTIALSRGDLTAAERRYGEALKIARVPDCLFNLSVIALTRAQEAEGRGDREVARREAEAALDLLREAEAVSPHDPDIQAGLGQSWSLLGRPENAERHYVRALELGVRHDTAEQIRQRLGAVSR